jgi:hypothetical protein
MRLTALRAAVLALLLPAAAVAAQRRAATEPEVKAAYLYNFARFVDWPARAPSAATPFVVCVIGSDPFGRVLDTTLADVTLRGAKAVARRIATSGEARACHLLFIGASEEQDLEAILGTLGSADVLTVSDMPAFVGRGGMIQFVNERGRLRFEVGLGPVERAGLHVSSDLLRVARAVNWGSGGAL